MNNVLEWLEYTADIYPSRIAYMDAENSITFNEVKAYSMAIGTVLGQSNLPDGPIAVFSSRNCFTPSYDLGVVYSGRAYAPLDSTLPRERIETILRSLQPAAILTDRNNLDIISSYEGTGSCPVFIADDIRSQGPDLCLLKKIRRSMLITDPLYIIYTSGSSGIPKGVITSHDSLIRYIDAYSRVMKIDDEDVFGNQSPLDYIAAIRDIYLPLKHGASTVIIPKEFFMKPEELFDYMEAHKVSALGWSVSAFTILNSLGGFDERGIRTLKKVCFSGSVMPGRCLRTLQQMHPDVHFVNQYGPTEATASCTYYVVDHLVEEGEILPIGEPYENYRVFILKEDNTMASTGELGEICVSGPCLALGYYRDPERTAASFLQNPLHNSYQERIYRTGDIGRVREDGLLEFHGRLDRQIKHMGHRVELDEIEVAANRLDAIDECCCIYLEDKEKLQLFYVGSMDKKALLMELRKTLPGFMVPRGVTKLDQLPKLANGKTDMVTLKSLVKR